MGDSEHRSKQNYNKISIGHTRMASFFRPIHKGTTKQQKELHFTMPQQTISAKGMAEILEQLDVEGVESRINYAASTLGQYDGDRPNRFYFDECFKVDKYDPYDQLDIVKPGLEANGGMSFSGKAFLASTVEEKGKDNFNEAITIPQTKRLWDDSNPLDTNKYGRTKSGLVRYFRDFTCSMPVDEYGFVDKKLANEWYEEEVKSFTKNKEWDKLANFKRRKPRSITDALQISSNECVYSNLLPSSSILAFNSLFSFINSPRKCEAILKASFSLSAFSFKTLTWDFSFLFLSITLKTSLMKFASIAF